MTINNLSAQDLDVLDGVERPSIAADLTPSNTISRPKQDGLLLKAEDIDESNIENLNLEDIKDWAPNQVARVQKIIFDKIQAQIQDLANFDSLTNTSEATAGSLAKSKGKPLEDFEAEAIFSKLREQIKVVRAKASRIKSSVDIRQSLQPTVVDFNPDEYALIKKGMVRVFRHKDNTITYEHYKACLAARDKIAKSEIDEQIKGGRLSGFNLKT